MLSGQLGGLPNRVSIEGHTDAQPYASKDGYGNWELSTDRANAARRVMQTSGLRQDQVSQVRGYADQKLRVPSNPMDPSNRRISLIVQYLTVDAPPVAEGKRGRGRREAGEQCADNGDSCAGEWNAEARRGGRRRGEGRSEPASPERDPAGRGAECGEVWKRSCTAECGKDGAGAETFGGEARCRQCGLAVVAEDPFEMRRAGELNLADGESGLAFRTVGKGDRYAKQRRAGGDLVPG